MTGELKLKNVNKPFRPSKKSALIILLATLFITLVSSLHGITEAWAWEVGKNLITVNGLVLGFIVFGATILSRRRLTQAFYESMIEETVDKLLIRAAEYEKSKKTLEEWVEKEYYPIWSQAFYEFGYKLGSLMGYLTLSVEMILVSIGLSFCLFGVSDININIWPERELFLLIYYSALYFFIAGVYFAFSLIATLLQKTALIHEKPSKTIARILEERMKQFEKQSKKG